jgi:cytidylate kinase
MSAEDIMDAAPRIIAVSGKSGCGNSTVSRLLAERLGLRLINFTFRNMAAERGITLEKVLELAKDDPSWDRELDARQVAMAQEGSCVIGSRLAIWLLKDAALSVYLYASVETRSRRIWNREGGRLEDVLEFTRERDAQDTRRYREIYGIDNTDYSFADLVINTERLVPERIVDIITAALNGVLERSRR